MLDPNVNQGSHSPDRLPPPPKVPRLPRVHAAKWPPDDDAMAGRGGGGAGMYGGGGADDGNFKRGAFKPIAILVALVAIVGCAVAVFLAMKSENEKMSVDAQTKERKEI